MLAILKIAAIPEPGITGWILATDIHDAHMQANTAGEYALAETVRHMHEPPPGKYELMRSPDSDHRYVLLVT